MYMYVDLISTSLPFSIFTPPSLSPPPLSPSLSPPLSLSLPPLSLSLSPLSLSLSLSLSLPLTHIQCLLAEIWLIRSYSKSREVVPPQSLVIHLPQINKLLTHKQPMTPTVLDLGLHHVKICQFTTNERSNLGIEFLKIY